MWQKEGWGHVSTAHHICHQLGPLLHQVLLKDKRGFTETRSNIVENILTLTHSYNVWHGRGWGCSPPACQKQFLRKYSIWKKCGRQITDNFYVAFVFWLKLCCTVNYYRASSFAYQEGNCLFLFYLFHLSNFKMYELDCWSRLFKCSIPSSMGSVGWFTCHTVWQPECRLWRCFLCCMSYHMPPGPVQHRLLYWGLGKSEKKMQVRHWWSIKWFTPLNKTVWKASTRAESQKPPD